jgi:paraquat-inducible protein B
VQQLLSNLAQFDVHGLSEKLNTLLSRLNTSLQELNVPAINAGVTNLLGSANRFLGSSDLTNSLTSLRKTFDDADILVKRVDNRVDSLGDSVTNTLGDAQKTLADLRVCLKTVSKMLDEDSDLRVELNRALEQVGAAGTSISDLADFLKRNPNALLVGKKQPKDKP